MEINVEDNFALLFDKNSNTAYRVLQTLQKECEESDKVYCYKDNPVFHEDQDDTFYYIAGIPLAVCLMG